jgi:type IV secretion system protein VirD4
MRRSITPRGCGPSGLAGRQGAQSVAIYRCEFKIISRAAGHKAVAAAAYRASEKIVDQTYGETHDFTRKSNVKAAFILAPENAPDWMQDRAKLWNAVEAAERRKDAQLSREVLLSLPHELTDAQREALIRQFVSERFVSRGMIADVAIHGNSPSGDERNYHAHVMLTTRTLTLGTFGPKERSWNGKEFLHETRVAWAEAQNRLFERLGLDLRVDHRSLADQGVDREPEPKLGPNATEALRNGEPEKAERVIGEYDAVKDRNADRERLKEQLEVIDLALARLDKAQGDRAAEAVAELALRHSRSFEALQDAQRTAQLAARRSAMAELRSAVHDARAAHDAYRDELKPSFLRRLGEIVTLKGREAKVERNAKLAAFKMEQDRKLNLLRARLRAEGRSLLADHADARERLRDIGAALAGLVLLYFILLPVYGTGMVFFTGAAAVVGGVVLGLWWFGKGGLSLPDTFGTSRWAKLKDLTDAGLTGDEGFRLGTFHEGKEEAAIRYAGPRHLLTVAPTRAGKGVAAIVPNLLTYRGSALVIDPKGENALITAKRRAALGQAVHLIDPWNIAAGKLGMKPARFNPLDLLKSDDPDLVENATLIADALVISSGGANDRFWDDEARAMIVGFILWVVTAPEEAGKRTLGRVRDLLVTEAKEQFEVFGKMIEADHPVVQSSGTRAMQKEEKVFSNVLATAQSHTNMLDSPRIRESLSASDLSFADLKAKPSTVFLVLPADRLDTYGRWLRLLVQQAILVNARNIETAPARPILFLLDEMAALGRLSMVEQAFGLMAGFGMQLWGIVQDLSQLRRLYGDGWETFIGNSGVLQYFGSRDRMTAEYFSALCGVSTVWNLSTAVSNAVGGGGNGSESKTTASAQRSLAYPDELMTLRQDRQLLLIENGFPIMARKALWYADPELEGLGNNLHKKE